LACVVLLGSMFWFFVDASKPLIMGTTPKIISVT